MLYSELVLGVAVKVMRVIEYSGQSRPLIPDESRPLSKDEMVGKCEWFSPVVTIRLVFIRQISEITDTTRLPDGQV